MDESCIFRSWRWNALLAESCTSMYQHVFGDLECTIGYIKCDN